MVDSFKIDSVNSVNAFENISKSKYGSEAIKEAHEKTIFELAYDDENVVYLKDKLQEVEADNGAIKKGWNDFKETVGIGTSAAKCDEVIAQYRKGEITFEEADAKISEYASKQENSLNLFSNIGTAIAAIGTVAAVAATVASGGTLAPLAAVAIGAGAGAVTKAGMKTLDKATNEVENDITAKDVVKDALSGAVTGGIAAATMGTASTAGSVGKAVTGCAKTGVETGAISGSSNYLIDCAFDEDKDFNTKELIGTTAGSALVGGTVGAIMGGVNGGLHATGALNSGCNLKTMTSGASTFKDVAANSACTAEYKVLNQGIRDLAA